jgi:hypothetical protein
LFGHDVDFTIGEGASAQTCTGTVGSLGSASCTIAQVEQLPQADLPVTASFGGDVNYLSISDDTTIEVTKRATQLEVETPPTTIYHDAVTLSAALFESGGIDPIAGRDLTLAIGVGAGAQSCQGTTDASGVVSCDIASVEQVPDPKVPVRAWFDGDLYYVASSGSTTFAVTKRATGLSITAPEFVADEGEIALSGTLVEAGDAPVAGRDVTFALGVGSERQTCTAATDSSGDAACTISGISQELGPQDVSAAFAGDAYYLPSGADDEVLVFAWTDGGTFVVGDLSASRSPTVTYWSSEWYLDSSLTGGRAPAAFKGFADSPSAPTDCATDWQSRGGGSTDAAEVIPGYTAMLVTDKVVKRGWRLSGSTTAIVVVRVGDGYQSSPGHASTAEILGYLCTD